MRVRLGVLGTAAEGSGRMILLSLSSVRSILGGKDQQFDPIRERGVTNVDSGSRTDGM